MVLWARLPDAVGRRPSRSQGLLTILLGPSSRRLHLGGRVTRFVSSRSSSSRCLGHVRPLAGPVASYASVDRRASLTDVPRYLPRPLDAWARLYDQLIAGRQLTAWLPRMVC